MKMVDDEVKPVGGLQPQSASEPQKRKRRKRRGQGGASSAAEAVAAPTPPPPDVAPQKRTGDVGIGGKRRRRVKNGTGRGGRAGVEKELLPPAPSKEARIGGGGTGGGGSPPGSRGDHKVKVNLDMKRVAWDKVEVHAPECHCPKMAKYREVAEEKVGWTLLYPFQHLSNCHCHNDVCGFAVMTGIPSMQWTESPCCHRRTCSTLSTQLLGIRAHSLPYHYHPIPAPPRQDSSQELLPCHEDYYVTPPAPFSKHC